MESLQAAGPAANEPDFTNAVTERKTVDINELRAYTALQDWLQDNDPEGTFLAQRDAAVETFGPLLDERTRLIKEVVRTLRELNDTAANSSGAPDPTYNARAAAHQQAKNEMSTNHALIQEHLNRIAPSPGQPLRRHQQQQRAVLRYSRNQRRPPLLAVAEDQHPFYSHTPYGTTSLVE